MNTRCAIFSHSSGLSSSPAWTRPGVLTPAPVDLSSPQATGTAGAVSPPAPATPLRESVAGCSGPAGPPDAAAAFIAGKDRPGISCIRTEDGTVILVDRLAGRAVSGATRQAAEAAMQRLAGSMPTTGTA